MALTRADYLGHLQALLPSGPAWPREAGATLTRVLDGLAAELARVDARVDVLHTEADPRAATELLPEWEALTGLPDPCLGDSPTLEQRRAAVQARLVTTGGQSPAYYIEIIGVALGLEASIVEYSPATCLSECTAGLDTDAPTIADCTSECTARLRVEGWRFVWQVRVPRTNEITVADCTFACNSALRAWEDTALECLVRRLSPAHTRVNFAYEEP